MVEIQPIRVEVEREDDGRILASVPDLPGVMVYGNTEDEAVVTAMELLKPWEATAGGIYWLAEQRRKRREKDDCGNIWPSPQSQRVPRRKNAS